MINEYRFVQIFLIVYLGWTLLEFTIKTTRREGYVPLYLMGLWYAAILFSVLDFLHFPQLGSLRFSLYHGPVWVNYSFLAFFVVGASMRFLIVRTLRRQDDPALYPQTGLFAVVRYPLYTAFLLQLFAVVLFYSSGGGLLITVVATAVVLWSVARQEHERMEMYGEAYGTFARQTKKLIPYIW
jgi:protein-S-isoprenylcysteine O-methyltransferase Ste14